MFKNFFLVIFLLLFLANIINAEHQLCEPTNELNIEKDYNTLSKVNTYTAGYYDIGEYQSNETIYSFRSAYKFVLPSLPANAYNKTANLVIFFSTTDHSTCAKLVHLANNYNFYGYVQSAFDAISGDPFVSACYSDGTVYYDITEEIFSTGYVNVGVYPQSTGHSIMYIRMYITYDLPVEIIADNNFTALGGANHGSITVDGSNKTAPYTFSKNVGQSVSLSAVSPQTNNNGYQMVWNNSSSCDASKWERSGSYRSYSQTYTFNAAADDNGKTYKANFHQNQATTSGSLSVNETWISSVALTGNVTVPSGKTLTISSCCSVNLNGHSITTTDGTIDLQGTVNGLKAKVTTSNVLKGLHPTIQSAIDDCPAYSDVDIVPGTINENVSVSGKNNLTIAGSGSTNLTGSFSLYGCNNLLLEAATLKQLNVYYCSPCTLWCDIDADFTDNGLGLFYCNLYNHMGSVNYCNTGLNAYSTSGFAECSDYGASSCNIYASSGSNITADYNWFCSPVTTDFIAVSSAYINPSGSYFPADHPVSSGNVAIPNPRFSCTAKKNVNFDESKDFPNSQILSDDPAKDEFSKVNDSYFSLMKKTKDNPKSREALKNGLPDILKAYKSFIKKNPKSTFSRTALTTAANSYWLTEDYNGRKCFLDEIINDKELTSLKGYAESMMIDNYIKAKDADGAITAADAFMEKYKNDGELICEGLMKKGLVLTYELNQAGKAAECFSAIVKNYPESPLASFAKNSLEAINEKAKGSKKEDKEVVSAGFSAGAYPNPFNPSTTIKYSLPENCRVSLEVYNILGEKAASLVNETKSAGSYSAVFNGSSLASGIYIYKITAVSMQTGKQFVKSDKIMLVK